MEKNRMTRSFHGHSGSETGTSRFMSGAIVPRLLIGLLATLIVSSAGAAPRTVRWSHPAISEVAGFRIVLGPASRSYDTSVDVGIPASNGDDYQAVVNVSDDRPSYIAIVAYNDAGDSVPSNEAVVIPDEASPPSPGGTLALLLNAGGPSAITIDGESWVADDDYAQTGTPRTSGVSVGGTMFEDLYRTERWGGSADQPMIYEVPVPDGTYEITLHWAETWGAAAVPGARLFDVVIEDARRLEDFDVFATAGFQQAVTRTFSTSVDDGDLSIEFHQRTDQTPFINAIEIEQVPNGASIAPPVLLQVVPVQP